MLQIYVRTYVCVFYFVIFLCCIHCQSGGVDRDITLTKSQKTILDQFTGKVRHRIKEAYMLEPLYLLRFLRARQFNAEIAEEMFVKHLNWRRDKRIDELDRLDWSYFEEEFGYSVDIKDKSGRPFITIDSTRWDVRQAVVSGQRDKLVLWMVKMMEDAARKVREYQKAGNKVTRWGIIFDLSYFNLVQSGCLQCITVYAEFVENCEHYYPNTVDKIFLVNTPMLFETVLSVVRPIMSQETRNNLRVYGTDKRKWQQALRKDFDAQELPKQFGGTRPDFKVENKHSS